MRWGFAYASLAVLVVWGAGRPKMVAGTRFEVPRWVVEFSREVHPFMPFGLLVFAGVLAWGHPVALRVSLFMQATWLFLVWLGNDDDDDDRWKRRRRRAADAVRAAGRRLVVVAAGT